MVLLRVSAITSGDGVVTVNHCVEECVTKNSYNGGTRNRKQLWWRIVRPWRLANVPLLLVPNDMSDDDG